MKTAIFRPQFVFQMKNYAEIVAPLTKLLRKDVKWEWGKDQNMAVSKIKSILTIEPVLTIFNPDSKKELHTDASSKGTAGILFQESNSGLKPMAYYSRATPVDESFYHSYELETLAVVESIKRFRIYLHGTHFKIVTDCSAVRSTFVKKELVLRIARWWLAIQDYDFEIEHRPGCKMSML